MFPVWTPPPKKIYFCFWMIASLHPALCSSARLVIFVERADEEFISENRIHGLFRQSLAPFCFAACGVEVSGQQEADLYVERLRARRAVRPSARIESYSRSST